MHVAMLLPGVALLLLSGSVHGQLDQGIAAATAAQAGQLNEAVQNLSNSVSGQLRDVVQALAKSGAAAHCSADYCRLRLPHLVRR